MVRLPVKAVQVGLKPLGACLALGFGIIVSLYILYLFVYLVLLIVIILYNPEVFLLWGLGSLI